MFPSTLSTKNAVDMFPRTDRLKDINSINSGYVSRAIDRANSDLFSEVFLYVKDEIDIPPEQITSCEEI